jgi:hypothetical protein
MSFITNINQDYVFRVAADYVDPIVTINFISEAGFEEWYNNTAKKHANWLVKEQHAHSKSLSLLGLRLETPLPVHTTVYLCDHAGKPRKNKEPLSSASSSQEPKKKKTKKNTIHQDRLQCLHP